MATARYRIADVALAGGEFLLTLADERVLTFPLSMRLEEATPADREGWELTEDRTGLNWPSIRYTNHKDQLVPYSAPAGVINIWTILQDQIYSSAMERAWAAEWKLDALIAEDRELVALWRLEADINNGGFIQFYENWGPESYRIAVAALDRIGAVKMAELVREMHAVLARYFEEGTENVPSDLFERWSEADDARMDELDEGFWEYPEDLPRLVVLNYDRASG